MQFLYKYLVLALLLIPRVSDAQATTKNKHTKNKEVIMTAIQGNKEVIRNLYEESLNKRNMALLRELISPDYVGVRGVKGAAGFEEPIVPLLKAFPDIQWNIETLVGEEDKVVVKWKWRGTHTAPFANFEASGKTISNEGVGIFELKNGKIIKSQVQTDRLGFLQELDVLPLDLTLLSVKKHTKDQVRFIDKFFVPHAAKAEFYERMRINRSFIKNLPGFIEDAAYEYTDADGNLICITVALWENNEALNKAREAVQAEYKKQGFDAAEMFKRLNITADRGIYTEVVER